MNETKTARAFGGVLTKNVSSLFSDPGVMEAAAKYRKNKNPFTENLLHTALTKAGALAKPERDRLIQSMMRTRRWGTE